MPRCFWIICEIVVPPLHIFFKKLYLGFDFLNKFLKCLPFALMHQRKAIKTRINLIFYRRPIKLDLLRLDDRRSSCPFKVIWKLLNFFPPAKILYRKYFCLRNGWRRTKSLALPRRLFTSSAHFYSLVPRSHNKKLPIFIFPLKLFDWKFLTERKNLQLF